MNVSPAGKRIKSNKYIFEENYLSPQNEDNQFKLSNLCA